MMSFSLKNLPIKRKLRYAMLITAYTVLLVTLSIQTIYDLINARTFLINDIEALADVTGSNAQAALTFEDSQSAERLLNGFATLPHIKLAYLVNTSGESIASYEIEAASNKLSTVKQPEISKIEFSKTRLKLYRPITLDSQLIGGIYIHSDLSQLYIELWKNLLVALLATLVSVIAAYILTSRLQKLLGHPVTELANIISDITINEQFDRQVHKFNQDEIGQLYDCFNEMMIHIQKRDKRLQEHRETLELAVAERTKELDKRNSELKVSIIAMNEAKEAALEAVKSKSIFLANMSHEIRTPMNGVLGMLELLQDTEIDDTQADFIETAYSSADTLLQVINDILDFSKIEAGKMEIESIDISINVLTEDVCALLTNNARDKNLELNCYTDPMLPKTVKGDPVRLRQILTNLLGNAIKFTEKGSITVSANLIKHQNETVEIQFSVEDTGIGIPSSVQDKLFSAFTQADGSTTRKFGGTGLGLTISRQLVQLMNGELRVQSEEGKGSIFSFQISTTISTNPLPTNEVNTEQLKGLKALIVDDNATNRKILKHYLDAWEVNYEEADCAKDALQLLKKAVNDKQPFDLAYLDLNMPEMDGKMLSEAINHDESIKTTKRILLSSLGTMSKSEREAYFISASLSKPYRQSRLLETTLEVLQKNDKKSNEKHKKVSEVPLFDSQNVTILLAEDNVVNQKVAISMLKKLGIVDVDIADDGAIAVEKVSSNSYDIVLMDCQMPKMSGYEATQVIRKNEEANLGKSSRIVIIAMTANAMSGDKEKCVASGMDDYLSKPIKSDIIADRLSYWLSQKSKKDINESKNESHNDIHNIDLMTDIINIKKIDELRQLMGIEFNTHVNNYIEDTEKLNCDIKIALQETDLEVLIRAAHTLHSKSQHIGAKKLESIAMGIESLALENNITEVSLIVSRLDISLKETITMIKKYQNKYG